MTDKNIITIESVSCYEQNGTAYLKLEDVARGLGFTQTKNGLEYVRWETVDKYLRELGVSQQAGKAGKDIYIPENIFYRLAMKAKNETAERFQALVADEIIPSIRKTGHYMSPAALREALLNPDTLIQLALQVKAEQEKNAKLTAENNRLAAANQAMQPKAEYFDRQVAANQLTGLYETADALHIPGQTFVRWLIEKKYLRRNGHSKLVPVDGTNDGLFQLREYDKTGKRICGGIQTMVTPKGRETFKLLLLGPLPDRKEEPHND